MSTKVWHIQYFNELFELPDDARYCRKTPLLFIKRAIGEGDGKRIYKAFARIMQKIRQLPDPDHLILDSIVWKLFEWAARFERCYRGYLLDDFTLRPADDEFIARNILDTTLERWAWAKEKLETFGIIHYVTKPCFDESINELPDAAPAIEPEAGSGEVGQPVNNGGETANINLVHTADGLCFDEEATAVPDESPLGVKIGNPSGRARKSTGNSGRARNPLNLNININIKEKEKLKEKANENEKDNPESAIGKKEGKRKKRNRQSAEAEAKASQNSNLNPESEPEAKAKLNPEAEGQPEGPSPPASAVKAESRAEIQGVVINAVAGQTEAQPEPKAATRLANETAPTTAPPGLPMVPNMPTDSDAGEGHTGPVVHIQGPPRSVISSGGKVDESVLEAIYEPSAQRFVSDIYLALQVPHHPDSPEGRREIANYQAAWYMAQQAGLKPDALLDLWRRAWKAARDIGRKRRRVKWRKGPEACWRSRYDLILAQVIAEYKPP